MSSIVCSDTIEICSICLMTMDSANSTFCHSLPCSHRFHTNCIVNSLRFDGRCPMCRDSGKSPKTIDDFTEDEWEVLMTEVWKRMTRQRNSLARKDDNVKKLRDDFWQSRRAYKKMYKKLENKKRRLERKYERLVERETADLANQMNDLEIEMEMKQMNFERVADEILYK